MVLEDEMMLLGFWEKISRLSVLIKISEDKNLILTVRFLFKVLHIDFRQKGERYLI